MGLAGMRRGTAPTAPCPHSRLRSLYRNCFKRLLREKRLSSLVRSGQTDHRDGSGPRSRVRMGLAGMPTATHPEGRDLTTTEPAPITTSSPIYTPAQIVTAEPHQTRAPI